MDLDSFVGAFADFVGVSNTYVRQQMQNIIDA